MTYEELVEKHKDRSDWHEYLHDLWNLPMSEMHKIPVITGCEKGKCFNCKRECDYK